MYARSMTVADDLSVIKLMHIKRRKLNNSKHYLAAKTKEKNSNATYFEILDSN